MNIISTGAFHPEMDASNKQETVAEKFARVWEKKNSKVARAGGVSLMALSLAACGSSSDTAAVTPVTPTPDPDPEPVAPVAPTVNNYTLETTDDFIAGKAGENDVIVASQTTYNANDAIVDADATDSDVLTVTATADISAAATVAGIETVNFHLDAFTAAGGVASSFEVAATNVTATVINIDNVKVGSTIATSTVSGLATTSTVNFSDDFTTATVDGDDDAALTMTTAATTATAESTPGTLASATVTSTAATAATIASDTDGTLTATTTAADMIVQGATATTVEATSAGSIDANTTDLTAATSVNLTASDEITVGMAAAASATLSAGGTTDSTVEDGVGNVLTSVSLSGNGSAHTFDLTAAEGIASVTITGDQAVNIEMTGADIDGLTDNALTIVDNSTATSTLELITSIGDMDLSAAAVDVINLGVDNNAKAITVATGAAVTISASQTDATIDGSDDGAASNTVAITLDDADLTNGGVDLTSLTFTDIATATIDASVDANTTPDDSEITTLDGSADNTSVTINAGSLGVELVTTANLGTGALVINSDGAVALGSTDITAASLTTTGSGAVTWTDANATEVVSVTTSSGADQVTWANLTESISINTAGGIDTVTLGTGLTAAKTYDINLGDGATDALVLANGGDYSVGTLTLTGAEILRYADNALTATMAAATLDGKGYILTHADASDTIDVTIALETGRTSLNLANLVVDGAGLTTADTLTVTGSGTAALNISGADGIGNDLTGGDAGDTLTGGTGDDELIGGDGGDVLTGNDGDDIITGGAGADVMTGGDGNDTYVFASAAHVVAGESIVEAASGGTDIVDVNATVDFTNMAASSFDEIDTLDIANSITATFTGEQLTGETIEIETATAGTATAIIVNVAFGGTVDLSSITATANWDVTEDTITINGLGGDETITGTAEDDTINLGAGADTLKVAFGGAGSDTITGFTVGASADVFDFTGTIDTTDGAAAYEAIGADGLTVAEEVIATGTGIAVSGTALATADAAGIEDHFDGSAEDLGFAVAGDTVYFLGDNGGNSYLFKITDTNGDQEFTSAADAAVLIATFSGIADCTTIVAANFADFA